MSEPLAVCEGPVTPYLAKPQQPRHSREGGNPVSSSPSCPRVPLSGLGRWSGGGTPSKANPAFWTNGTIPWVSPKDMKTERISKAEDYITEEAVANSATRMIRKGAVVVVARSGILKHSLPVAVADRDITLNQDLKAVELKDGILPEYVAWALRASARDILHRCAKTGTTVQNLEIPAFLRYEIPLAPLAEQRRIVAELETQLTRLDAGVTALKRVQANLKRYRASVLKAAREGRLVPTEAELARCEGRRYETGAALLGRVLAAKPNIKERKLSRDDEAYSASLVSLPEGWTSTSVSQLGEVKTGFTPPKDEAMYFGGDIPFFKPTDLDAGYYVRDYRESLTEAGAERGRILPARSILVTCIGATIGKTGLARRRCTTNQQINALSVSESFISPEYVFWFFTSPAGQKSIAENASATTLPILNKSRFQALNISLPPLAEQQRIVAEVERRLSVIEKLEATVAANLKRAGRLRGSVLGRAFS